MHLSVLKIEIDGHFHGGAPVKPWVAEIIGLCPRYGVKRVFLDRMTDWKHAKAAWSGNVYGRVAHFALRDGRVYEVQRTKGKPSKRRVVREFFAVEGDERVELSAHEVLTRVVGEGPTVSLRCGAEQSSDTWIAHITRLGTPERIGYVGEGGTRHYRLLPDRLYEVMDHGARKLVFSAPDDLLTELSDREALAWLTENLRST